MASSYIFQHSRRTKTVGEMDTLVFGSYFEATREIYSFTTIFHRGEFIKEDIPI